MIIVTGANGQLGRAIVERLLERVPAERIGVSVRDPEKARDLERRGVRVRCGDFDDAASLADAFEGASRVLIVSVDNLGEAAVRQHRAAIDAAKAAGAGRIFYTSQVAAGAEPIFYTSHVGADPIPAFPPMVDHAATEAALRDAGVAYTSLRNGFYAQTAAFLVRNALETGELRAPQDGPIDYTTIPRPRRGDGHRPGRRGLRRPHPHPHRPRGRRHGRARGARLGAGGPPDPPGRRRGRRVSRRPGRPRRPRAAGRHVPGPVRRGPAGRVHTGRPDARSPDRPATDTLAGRPQGGDRPRQVRLRHQSSALRPARARVALMARQVAIARMELR